MHDDRIRGAGHVPQDFRERLVVGHFDHASVRRPWSAVVQNNVRPGGEHPAFARRIMRPGNCEAGLRIAFLIEADQRFEDGGNQLRGVRSIDRRVQSFERRSHFYSQFSAVSRASGGIHRAERDQRANGRNPQRWNTLHTVL